MPLQISEPARTVVLAGSFGAGSVGALLAVLVPLTPLVHDVDMAPLLRPAVVLPLMAWEFVHCSWLGLQFGREQSRATAG